MPAGDRRSTTPSTTPSPRPAAPGGAPPQILPRTSARSRAIIAAMRAGRIASAFSSHACSRSGCPAMKNITSSAPTATGAITSPPNRIAWNTAESRASSPGSNQIRNAASSSSTATRSRMRSTRIVANAAVALRPSRRASRYGRITSPARAGSTAEARKADHRRAKHHARTASARAAPAGTASARPESGTSPHVKPSASNRKSGRAAVDRCPHPSEIRVPKKNRKKADGKADDNYGPDDVAQTISILQEVSLLRHTPLIGPLRSDGTRLTRCTRVAHAFTMWDSSRERPCLHTFS